MLAAPGPKPVGEIHEVGLVDGVQYLDRRTLNDFILQRCHPQRPQPPVGLGYVHPTHRLGPVRPCFYPAGELTEVFLQVLAVGLPRLAVHPRRGLLL
jgi:hypothetical protein